MLCNEWSGELFGCQEEEGDLRCYAGTARQQRDVLVFVFFPRVLRQWALDVQSLSGVHGMKMLRHGPIGVAFDNKVYMTSRI